MSLPTPQKGIIPHGQAAAAKLLDECYGELSCSGGVPACKRVSSTSGSLGGSSCAAECCAEAGCVA